MQRLWLNMLLLSVPLSWSSMAVAVGAGAAQPRVMFGRCELARDPEGPGESELPWVMGCFKGAAGAEMVFVSGTPDENYWLKYGNLYGGLFFSSWVSLQARGHARAAIPLGEFGETGKDVDTDYAALQIGNPATHDVRLTTGKVQLPFGVDQSEVVENYKVHEDRRFWSSPDHGAYVTLDDQKNFQVDFGYGTNEFTDRTIEDEAGTEVGKVPAVQAETLRLMSDFAALDGSRLVLSGYSDTSGARKMGAGFVTVSRKEDITLFEFVRRLSTPGGHEEPFSQLLRVGYVGAWRGDTRWVVQFDDERFRFRRGVMGYDAKVYDHAILRFGVAYHKSETGDQGRRWYVTTGLEARL